MGPWGFNGESQGRNGGGGGGNGGGQGQVNNHGDQGGDDHSFYDE